MSLVLDASLTLSWYFEDEATPETDAVLDRVVADGAMVPGLWRLEVANALQMAVQRKRCDASFRDRALAELACMAISIDAETNAFAWTTTLHLAERHGLSVYDAAYLELALRQRTVLATLDGPLRTASVAAGVEVVPARAG